MRKIPVALAVLGLTALTLTGCGLPAGQASCARPVSAGDADLIRVSGDIGSAPEVSVPTPLVVTTSGFEDVVVGDGTAVTQPDQTIAVEFTIIDGTTGQTLVQTPYDGALTRVGTAAQLSTSVPGLAEALTCVTAGSRTVVALAPDDIDPQTATGLGLAEGHSAVFVLDVPKVYLPHAEGTLVYNDAIGLPTVVRAPDGRPGVIIPDAAAPDTLVTQTLIAGDGPAISADQSVRVQYTELTWDGRKVVTSTWDTAPTSLTFDAVVPGLAQALEGATVGSQLLVVVPPDLGYGDQEQSGVPAGSTLVYVVDILGIDGVASE